MKQWWSQELTDYETMVVGYSYFLLVIFLFSSTKKNFFTLLYTYYIKRSFRLGIYYIMTVTRLEVLRLYKNLIYYSRTLKLTDPVYFKGRVSSEFRSNKALADAKEITFAYKVGTIQF